jgi:membrane-bound lytic murein transglycosylase A
MSTGSYPVLSLSQNCDEANILLKPYGRHRTRRAPRGPDFGGIAAGQEHRYSRIVTAPRCLPGSLRRFVSALVLAAACAPAAIAQTVPAADGTVGTAARAGGFAPQTWAELPAWSAEDHRSALDVFIAACPVLQRRAAWRAVCARSDGLAAADRDRAREFFEREFAPWRVGTTAAGEFGLLTGYFEPVIAGSPERRPPFVVPVLGVPADLLLLDARRLRRSERDRPLAATVRGRDVIPLAPGEPPPSNEVVYAVDRAVLEDEPLDRRLRVRIDGERIVRYWSRADIEAGRAAAPVLAWVDDPQALYVVQVQGAGRIRMPDGKVVRLAYADQNGHPFRPTRGPDAGDGPAGVRARSLGTGDAPEPAVSESARALISDTRSDADVQQVIDTLLRGGTSQATAPRPAVARSPTPPPTPDPGRRNPAVPRPAEGDIGASMNMKRLAGLVAARAADPSYVFFARVPADRPGNGPLGALGVALTAARSLAVDPRITPLGAPVFIDADRKDAPPIRRLMFAHDTGGAIRGPGRGDFFWGTGAEAGRQAFRTRAPVSMWVLLPRDIVPNAVSGIRTRSIGGESGESECTLPDDTYC